MTMASPSVAPVRLHSRELDAAQALLGVSPATTASTGSAINSREPSMASASSSSSNVAAHGFTITAASSHYLEEVSTEVRDGTPEDSGDDPAVPPRTGRPRSNSAGLDALAMLAESEAAHFQQEEAPLAPFIMRASPSTSSEDDCSVSSGESMPPPPPRRRRSSSNPEGMEKWDSLGAPRGSTKRRHFVLPESILEEEMAEASAAMLAQQRRPPRSIPEHAVYLEEDDEKDLDEVEEEEDLSNLTPSERLHRARSKLLEDLSEGNIHGEKGVIALPHSLGKYKNVYNRNGRIGIYTPDERAAVIERFKSKRGRRVWNKKIRYGCRKNLADRRLRVKGRFVKREEQEELAKQLKQEQEQAAEKSKNKNNAANMDDEDMPDVNDPEAGFEPTEEQPYRRVRRHTIT